MTAPVPGRGRATVPTLEAQIDVLMGQLGFVEPKNMVAIGLIC
jgi:hypothetical protein